MVLLGQPRNKRYICGDTPRPMSLSLDSIKWNIDSSCLFDLTCAFFKGELFLKDVVQSSYFSGRVPPAVDLQKLLDYEVSTPSEVWGYSPTESASLKNSIGGDIMEVPALHSLSRRL